MRFAFTDDQFAFRDGLRDLLEKECTPAHVRDAWKNETGRVPGLWDQLVDMGVTRFTDDRTGAVVQEAEQGAALDRIRRGAAGRPRSPRSAWDTRMACRAPPS